MSADPLIGRDIDGRLTVIERLNEGGMGVVYRARCKQLGAMLALTVIHPTLVATPDLRERFLRAARARVLVPHPNVVSVRGVGEVDGQLYFTMDLVEGRTIRDILEADGAFGTQRAVRVAVQILHAREAGHGEKMVRHGLHPARVMLADNDVVRLLAFEPADWAGPAGPCIMSPDQIVGDPVDARTDVYMFCGFLYQLLTGSRPHLADSVVSLYRKIMTEDPTPLVGPVGGVVMQGLARKKDDRPASLPVLRGRLEQAVAAMAANPQG